MIATIYEPSKLPKKDAQNFNRFQTPEIQYARAHAPLNDTGTDTTENFLDFRGINRKYPYND